MKNIAAEVAGQIVRHFESEGVRQLLDDTKAASEEVAGSFEVVITTENLDRYNEVIKLDGWELEHYRKNPVVLWGHNHNQPIGVATSVEIADGKMVANGKFAPTDFAQEIRKLYDAGIIRATSVGFIEKEREGNLITKAELLEFSFVSVPANPHCLTLAMEREFSVNELVTKGFMHVEKADEPQEPVNATESGDAPADGAGVDPAPEVPAEAPTEPQERSFSTRELAPVVESLRSALVALEALGIKSEEPEGDEELPAEGSDEERAFKEFSEKRKLIQEAATVIGDVLAEARQVIEAKKRAA